MECPNCDATNLDDAVFCECGYQFVGYDERVEEEDAARERGGSTRRALGWGLLLGGLALTAGTLVLSVETGASRFLVFTSMIVAGAVLLMRR